MSSTTTTPEAVNNRMENVGADTAGSGDKANKANSKLFALYAKFGTKKRCSIKATIGDVDHGFQMEGTAYTTAQINKLAEKGNVRVTTKHENGGVPVANRVAIVDGDEAIKTLNELREAVKEQSK